MNKYKICVYAICKNEEKFVDKWMDSMSEADYIVVTDTGSSDMTVEKLRNRGATVYVDVVNPWRFDVARNISLEHVPVDVDICVCTDLDEVFEEGWRKKLEDAWIPKATMGRYLYNWSIKEDGTPDVQFNYFKIHTRNDYEWVYPVHECLKYIGTSNEIKIFLDGVVLNHFPDKTKTRGSYLALLELAVKETPDDDRVTYYLGREYMYKGMWEKSIEILKKHLYLKSATWKDERCASMRWIALSYYKLSNINEAYSWYYRAIAESPKMRDPYVEFARMAYYLSDWSTVFHMTQEALKIKEKSSTYVNMGYSWDYTPDDLCSISCYHLGMYDKSLFHAKEALSKDPDNDRLINNIHLIEEKIKDNI
ncbi:hypothetical protein J2Z76_000062 [Sedimentibacter acidaminivorans]|uniref:Glycosyl transferase family 2 n=1 Tax=Sedimentibacter acidaminivorans TaxID=913099 RepID=A0ABS4G954_9FIRM|nr:glycosyl transferase family 2 [Sedimentibacter acidaminivorans]MBP1924209.1 hypothetical protein [Sedimentibacter acidaminivorans]